MTTTNVILGGTPRRHRERVRRGRLRRGQPPDPAPRGDADRLLIRRSRDRPQFRGRVPSGRSPPATSAAVGVLQRGERHPLGERPGRDPGDAERLQLADRQRVPGHADHAEPSAARARRPARRSPRGRPPPARRRPARPPRGRPARGGPPPRRSSAPVGAAARRRTKASVRALSTKSIPASRPAREHRLDGGDGLVQRPHLVLEVAADDAGRDRPAGGLAGVAVAGLEVHGHRQVHGGGDPADHVQVQVERDVLAVLVAERRRDRVAGGGQGPDAVGRRRPPGPRRRPRRWPGPGSPGRCAGRAGCGRGSARSGMQPNLVRVSEIVRACPESSRAALA